MSRFAVIRASLMLLAIPVVTLAADGNRFTYLDQVCDPYYVHGELPKLITPQWIGEEDVEAVVVLAVDDRRDTKKYEAYLRPILDSDRVVGTMQVLSFPIARHNAGKF